MPDEDASGTPPTVIGAIAAGVAPAPFLLTYSILFLVHGTVSPVDPPDITGSRAGEAIAGLVALAFLGLIVLGLARFLSRRARWLFLAGQLATLALSIDFLVDATSGQPEVPFALAVASAGAVVLGCVPPSWNWIDAPRPRHASGATTGLSPALPAEPGIWGETGAMPIDPNPGGGFTAGHPHGT